MAALIVLDIPKFRALYPEFKDTAQYLDVRLDATWEQATCFVSERNCGVMRGKCREQGLMLMLAHLLKLSCLIENGDAPTVISSSSIDKISVTLTPPPIGDAWEWWLQTTPYGAQLVALLAAFTAGGLWVGGSPEQAAFRGVGGRF